MRVSVSVRVRARARVRVRVRVRGRERERDHAEARSQDGSNFTTRIHNCDPLNTQAANKSSSGLMMSRFIASHLLS